MCLKFTLINSSFHVFSSVLLFSCSQQLYRQENDKVNNSLSYYFLLLQIAFCVCMPYIHGSPLRKQRHQKQHKLIDCNHILCKKLNTLSGCFYILMKDTYIHHIRCLLSFLVSDLKDINNKVRDYGKNIETAISSNLSLSSSLRVSSFSSFVNALEHSL